MPGKKTWQDTKFIFTQDCFESPFLVVSTITQFIVTATLINVNVNVNCIQRRFSKLVLHRNRLRRTLTVVIDKKPVNTAVFFRSSEPVTLGHKQLGSIFGRKEVIASGSNRMCAAN